MFLRTEEERDLGIASAQKFLNKRHQGLGVESVSGNYMQSHASLNGWRFSQFCSSAGS
jgi:hypothetical protein